MVDYERLIELRESFKNLEDYKEENIKIKIIIEALKAIGYSLDTFNFELPVYDRNKILDFIIKVSNKEHLYVETKRGDNELVEKDIVQILDYLSRCNVEWGLLTNGKNYILLNRKVEPIDNRQGFYSDKIVLAINLFSNSDLKLIKYLSKEYIFESKVSLFLKDIAQFKALKYPGDSNKSWLAYKSTLFGFFDYYAENEKKYRQLEEVRVDDFENYLKYDQSKKEMTNKKINSLNTFNNKYSHIRSMFIELKKNKKITSHHFEEERKNLINNFDNGDLQEVNNHLTKDNVQLIINYFKQNDKSVRDLVIFMLCVYIGLERSTISSIKWEMFDFSKRIMKIDRREIPISTQLYTLLKELEKENKESKIKGNYLFYTYYGKRYNILKENSINQIFKRIEKIDESDARWKEFSPQYIRNNLIRMLFENDYSIDEISYITGMDLANISNIISFRDICKKVNTRRNIIMKKHPFNDFL
jgi:integrase/recombinase XerD